MRLSLYCRSSGTSSVKPRAAVSARLPAHWRPGPGGGIGPGRARAALAAGEAGAQTRQPGGLRPQGAGQPAPVAAAPRACRSSLPVPRPPERGVQRRAPRGRDRAVGCDPSAAAAPAGSSGAALLRGPQRGRDRAGARNPGRHGQDVGPPGPGQASPQSRRHHPGPHAQHQGAIMTLEEQLQDAYERAAELVPVSPGAYDRFLRRRARRGRVVAAATGLALVAVLGAAVLVARQLPQDREPAAPAANAAELANRAATAAAAQSIPTSRPHQWVYTKELTVESGVGKPFTHEYWVRVDGKKYAQPTSNLRAARPRKVIRERRQLPPSQCLLGLPARVRPAVGLGRFFPNPAAVPTDPDGLLAAVYQLLENPDPACPPGSAGITVWSMAPINLNASGRSRRALPGAGKDARGHGRAGRHRRRRPPRRGLCPGSSHRSARVEWLGPAGDHPGQRQLPLPGHALRGDPRPLHP